ncbi:helix-turn-helix transcriptional regulator [Paenibacillus sp. J2TS4]|uniref:helix-turn-helix transcriptional regulator n=1 Tax=Paenibacillus sp. J2TS4 TaxID=2807194 RepID=UPI001B016E95|nr:helix-turn-helix transcriptional regulator [Paenibacillus sp. J2TS4]GIP31450.1 transcriptional regulator [Paenibacillus sp. J2TS4]
MEKWDLHKSQEGTVIKLSSRQLEIVELVRRHAPITGEQLAEALGLSRPTIRSDLSLLVMLGYLDAKPKVGYFLGTYAAATSRAYARTMELKVRDVQAVPVVVRDNSTVQDAVVTMFTEDVGGLTVVDEKGRLAGIVSRKDLLKVTLGNAAAATMPISLVMSREPNIVTVTPDDSVLDAARKLISHEVDMLPVVAEEQTEGREVVGRITKTIITKVFIGMAGE